MSKSAVNNIWWCFNLFITEIGHVYGFINANYSCKTTPVFMDSHFTHCLKLILSSQPSPLPWHQNVPAFYLSPSVCLIFFHLFNHLYLIAITMAFGTHIKRMLNIKRIVKHCVYCVLYNKYNVCYDYVMTSTNHVAIYYTLTVTQLYITYKFIYT